MSQKKKKREKTKKLLSSFGMTVEHNKPAMPTGRSRNSSHVHGGLSPLGSPC